MESEEHDEVLHPPNEFAFPFPPYTIQKEFMKILYETLEFGKLGIFESPTGTGKSLSIACGSLQWLKDHEERKIRTLMKKIEKLNLEKTLVKDDDWINEQYTIRLYDDKIHKIDQELNNIDTYKKRMDNIKSKRKTKEVKEKYNFSMQENMIKEEVEDAEYLLDERENESNIENETQDEELPNTHTQILFASRTHSQLSQMIGEISKSPHNDIRTVTLASRQTYCLNSSVRALKHNSAINEKCLDLQKTKNSATTKTDEFNKTVKRKKTQENKCCAYKNANNMSQLEDLILSDIVDVEDLIKEGKSLNACPYYASRASLKDSQFIALPYQTLLCERTRKISGVNIKDNIIIIDEAHNLLDTIAGIHSAILTMEQIKLSSKVLRAYGKKYGSRLNSENYLRLSQLIFVTKQLIKIFDKIEKSKMYVTAEFVDFLEFDNINLLPIVQLCNRNNFVQKVAGYGMQYPDEVNNIDEIRLLNKIERTEKTGTKAFLKLIQANQIKLPEKVVEESKPPEKSDDPNLSLISCLYALQAFLDRLTDKYDDGRVLVSKQNDQSKNFVKYLLLNPGNHFQDIVKEARSVIVAGGTMQPFDEFKLQLFGLEQSCRVNTFSCGHVVPAESLCPIIMSKGPSGKNLLFNYSNRSNPELMKEISMILQNICNVVPGGVVCFFPSYQYEQEVFDYLKQNKIIENIEKRKTIFREPKASNQVESILQKYTKCINNAKNKISNLSGALMLGVVGGKISEGLNFSDDLGRCVIVVGMPYPNKTSVELNEKILFLNKNLKNRAGDIYYENLCFKAVNQCIGRAIRHINDYAAIVLVDERYGLTANQTKLSNWIQSSLKTPHNFPQCFALLRNFFHQKKLDNLK